MGLVKTVIRFAAPLPQVEAFDRYLFVGPHPDDIEIGAGATIRKLTEAGKRVTFLICTDGRYGDGASGGVTGDELAALRERESFASAERLGVKDVRFLRLCDGAGYAIHDLERGIADAAADTQAQILFAPDPLSRSECHADHLNVGNAVRKIACFAPYVGIMQNLYGMDAAPVEAVAFYMTARPNRFVKTGKRLADQLAAIFDCHISQYPSNSAEADSIRLYLRLRSAAYGIRTLSRGAEGFRILGKTHLHCLPEAGEIG